MKTLKKTLAVLMAVLMLFSTMVIASAAEGNTVAYFVNTDNWAEVVAHVWVDGGEALNTWPGEACTLVEGTDNVYAFDMTTGNRIIFNNNNNGVQTANLNGEDAIGKYYEPKTAAFYDTAEAAVEAAANYVPVAPTANTVYFVNAANWATVNGYVWGGVNGEVYGGWPGSALSLVDGTENVYACDLYDSTGLVFNDGSGTQTSDIIIDAEMYGLYYEFTTNSWYASAEEAMAAAGNVEPPKTEMVKFEPTPLDKMENMFFVIAGDESLFGSNWDAADRNNELVYNEETRLYEKTYENVADGTYKFKVTTDGAWDLADFNLVGDAKFGGPNAEFKVAEAGATVKIVFDYQRAYVYINGEQVAAEVEVTDPTDPSETDPTVPTGYCLVGYINGADFGMGEDTDTIGNVFAEDNTFVYTFTENSYVCVKDTANKNWFMTAGYLGEEVTSATLHNTANQLPEGMQYDKLFVPAGTYEFTLVENGDGTLTLSYAATDKTPTTGTEPTESTAPTEAVEMEASAAKTSLKAGKTTKATVTGNTGDVTYVSSNKKVATVDANGKVVALKAGEVTITATDAEGNTDEVTIKVTSSPKLNKSNVTVKVGKKTTVKITGQAAGTKVKVSKCKVANVTVKGKKITIQGKKAGTKTVKVTVNGVKLNLKVTVKKK